MGIKKTIKKSFFGRYCISLYHCMMCKIVPALESDEKAVKKYFKKKTGKEIDLHDPKTFAEKINWYKLNVRTPLMCQCVDKADVRDYVKAKGYGNTLNEVYGVYDKVSEIDIDSLPESFVIKPTHGSHMIYIVKDKARFDWKHAKKMMKTWLHQDIYWSGREWAYKDIPKRIIIEKYLEDSAGELRDYKFFCYHGKPEYMEYDVGRMTTHYRNFYDMDKNVIDIFDNERLPQLKDIPFPLEDEVFEEMKKMAAAFSEPFQQVRVDFYYADKIYFGELTFYDGGGSTVFYPDEWNYKFSEKWHVTK